jgi:prepilin-type N-terminal cleavage/methylation domain-containing protein
MEKRRTSTGRVRSEERGFTILEMLLATVIVLVGLVAVAQLVPTAIMVDSNSRNDATALVFGQRVLEGMRSQPLSIGYYADPQLAPCATVNVCLLGNPTQPSVLVGNPVNTASGSPIIDFSGVPVGGYGFTYVDPNDPLGASYDVRWAVVTRTSNGGIATSKRIILGVFRRGMKSPTLPVTLDTMVSK